MSEREFHPYIKETMNLLVEAGKVTIDEQEIAKMDPVAIAEMRHALIDSFVSITNGLKFESAVSQQNNMPHGVSELEIYEQITFIFFYMEELLQREDLQRNNVEFAH